MMAKLLLVCCLVVAVLLEEDNSVLGSQDLQNDISLQLEKNNGTSLSRKRRFLQFPAGSSFQLVFCFTYTSVAVGSYFVFGHTAALAFELPSMPLFFDQRDFQKKEEEPAETTTTEKPQDFDYSELEHDKHERISSDLSWDQPINQFNKKIDSAFTNSQSTKPYINGQPVSAYNNPFLELLPAYKYSSTIRRPSVDLDNGNSLGDDGAFTGNMGAKPVKRYNKTYNFNRYNNGNSHMRLNMDPIYYQAHRRSRRDLYKRIENFLGTINLDGKACVLKAICEIRKSTLEKETFMVEAFKGIFRAKPHDNYHDEDEYDVAANPKHNCTEMYPSCRGSIRNIQILLRK